MSMLKLNRKKLLLLSGCLVTAAIAVFIYLKCNKAPHNVEQATDSLFAMDTYMTFLANGENAHEAIDEAKQLILDCENRWSVTNEESEISRLNKNGSALLSEQTGRLLSLATEYSAYSNGCFDPTVYPLVKAWGFTSGSCRVPDSDEIVSLLPLVGEDKINVSDNAVRLAEGSMVDLGGIAKGHVGDLVLQVFRDRHITSALISLGGNIQTLGSKPDGSKWRIGIKSPYDGNELLGSVRVGECCVITSGAYERYFIADDGTRYGHIVSPFTGYPASDGLLSATVICSQGSFGDALSTALFVMGTEEAIKFWKNHDGFDVILLSDDGTLYVSEGIFSAFSPSENQNVKSICEIKQS